MTNSISNQRNSAPQYHGSHSGRHESVENIWSIQRQIMMEKTLQYQKEMYEIITTIQKNPATK
jgi:hypothetical protein